MKTSADGANSSEFIEFSPAKTWLTERRVSVNLAGRPGFALPRRVRGARGNFRAPHETFAQRAKRFGSRPENVRSFGSRRARADFECARVSRTRARGARAREAFRASGTARAAVPRRHETFAPRAKPFEPRTKRSRRARNVSRPAGAENVRSVGSRHARAGIRSEPERSGTARATRECSRVKTRSFLHLNLATSQSALV